MSDMEMPFFQWNCAQCGRLNEAPAVIERARDEFQSVKVSLRDADALCKCGHQLTSGEQYVLVEEHQRTTYLVPQPKEP